MPSSLLNGNHEPLFTTHQDRQHVSKSSLESQRRYIVKLFSITMVFIVSLRMLIGYTEACLVCRFCGGLWIFNHCGSNEETSRSRMSLGRLQQKTGDQEKHSRDLSVQIVATRRVTTLQYLCFPSNGKSYPARGNKTTEVHC